MTFDDYLAGRAIRNPALMAEGKMTVGIAVFRSELQKAFDSGRDVGIETAHSISRLAGVGGGYMFGGFTFGGRR